MFLRHCTGRRDHMARTGALREGPLQPSLALDLGERRRGLLPHRLLALDRGRKGTVRRRDRLRGAGLRPPFYLQEPGPRAPRQGDSPVVLGTPQAFGEGPLAPLTPGADVPFTFRSVTVKASGESGGRNHSFLRHDRLRLEGRRLTKSAGYYGRDDSAHREVSAWAVKRAMPCASRAQSNPTSSPPTLKTKWPGDRQLGKNGGRR